MALSRLLPISGSALLYGIFWKQVLWFGLAILIASLIKGLFMFLMRQLLIVTSRNIEFDQKNEIFRKYESLGESFYRNHYTGDLMSRITEDVSNVRMYIGPSIMYFVNILFSFIMVITQMLSINAWLTLWVLIPLPFLSYSIYVVSKKINRGNKRIQEQLSVITTKAQETFAGIRIIKSFGAEENFSRDFKRSGEEFQKKNLELAKINAIFFPLMTLLMGLSTIIVLYVGGWEVQKGNFTPGNVAEFIIYLNMLIWPVASLGWTTALVQKASASQGRINEFLKQEEENIVGTQSFAWADKITLKDVTYKYLDKETNALSQLNVEIKKGEFIGVAGKTGSGKSTLMQILSRQLDLQEGEYMVDGQPIASISLKAFRSKLAYVQQDVFLFSDTLEENIAFGSEQEFEQEQMDKVVKFAGLEKDIKLFPKGLKTIVGERGVSLSGGQKQRMSLARALMRDAEIYLLDDCLSAVDAETESTVIEGLKKALFGKTIIMSSHRIAPIIKADKILVIEEGRVADVGKHEELIKNNLYYRWLSENQSVES